MLLFYAKKKEEKETCFMHVDTEFLMQRRTKENLPAQQ